MNDLKIALCFLDSNNKPIVMKSLSSNWSVELGANKEIKKKSYRNKVREEIAEILTENVRREINKDVLKEMLEKIGE